MNQKFAHLYDKDILTEIAVGLVLHLDPDVLESEGGSFTCEPSYRVQGQHFFVCVSVKGGLSRWLPLYTNPGDGRTLLDPASKKGHPKWRQGQHYWHAAQVWEAGANAIFLAAGRAHDKSRSGSRNTIAAAAVPNV